MSKKTYRINTPNGFVKDVLYRASVAEFKFDKEKFKEWGSLDGVRLFINDYPLSKFGGNALIQELEYKEAEICDYENSLFLSTAQEEAFIAYDTSKKKYFNTSKGFNTNLMGAKLYPSVEKLKKSIHNGYEKAKNFYKTYGVVGIDFMGPECVENESEFDTNILQNNWKIIRLVQESKDLPNAMNGFDSKNVSPIYYN